MDGARLPGAPADAPERIVCHVDMDCFYAACERLREPALEGEPVVVGMGYEDGETHGAVATASYEARAHGVESAQAISEALASLPRASEADETEDDEPRGHYRSVDMAFYEDVAADVKEILHDSADTVREVSIDEAYLDVTDRTDWERAEAFAADLRAEIERDVGVVASVGVAPDMSTAKVASDHDKPDGLVVVEPGDVEAFLAPLSVEEIHGIGPVTARELRSMGIETAGDLADADRSRLVDRFGERGGEFHDRARGNDDRPVEPVGKPKSLSRESAFTEATDDDEAKRERVRTLAADVAERASAKGALYRTIGLKVVTPPFDVHTRAESLPGPVDDPALLESVALDLLSEFADREVRKLGVRVSKLDFTDREQARLTGFETSDAPDGPPSDGGDSPGPERGQTTFSDFGE